jgi:hypothetical protein
MRSNSSIRTGTPSAPANASGVTERAGGLEQRGDEAALAVEQERRSGDRRGQRRDRGAAGDLPVGVVHPRDADDGHAAERQREQGAAEREDEAQDVGPGERTAHVLLESGERRGVDGGEDGPAKAELLPAHADAGKVQREHGADGQQQVRRQDQPRQGRHAAARGRRLRERPVVVQDLLALHVPNPPSCPRSQGQGSPRPPPFSRLACGPCRAIAKRAPLKSRFASR